MMQSSSKNHILLHSYNLLFSVCLWQCLLSVSSATTHQDWKKDRMVCRYDSETLWKLLFPPQEGKRPRRATTAHAFHSSLLKCFLLFPPNPRGRRFAHSSTLLRKGEYLLKASILKANVHLDSLSPVTASSRIPGRQRIGKEVANEEGRRGPSRPAGACAHSLPWSSSGVRKGP